MASAQQPVYLVLTSLTSISPPRPPTYHAGPPSGLIIWALHYQASSSPSLPLPVGNLPLLSLRMQVMGPSSWPHDRRDAFWSPFISHPQVRLRRLYGDWKHGTVECGERMTRHSPRTKADHKYIHRSLPAACNDWTKIGKLTRSPEEGLSALAFSKKRSLFHFSFFSFVRPAPFYARL